VDLARLGGSGVLTSSGQPKVSIGLPVFNGERFLARAVDSVRGQTFDDWELLISDNGSTDSTLSIARDYASRDPRIAVRGFPENQGAVANFEATFRETHGDYFMWLAHDDWLDPKYLESCLRILESHPVYVMAFAGMNVVDDSGQPFRHRIEPLDGIESASAITRFHAILWRLKDPTSPVFGLARRDALERTGLIRNSNEPDRILIGELGLLGRIHQNEELLFYHYGPPGHTRRDNWAWLNPRNRGRPRFATFRIIHHQWNAIWGSEYGFFERVILSLDLVVASIAKRIPGKIRAIRRQMAVD
jgi:glycosyltransferase involved in cell wall biosynthesis